MTAETIKKQLKIEKIIQETPDTKTIRLKLEKPMDFAPGQFVMLGLDLDIDGEKKLVKRAYSIASSPTKKDYLELTFNIYPKGQLSPHLYALKEGDNLYVEGPFGKFNFKEDNSRRAIFIGAGAGLTPLMSMIRYCADKKLPAKSTLIYSVKKPENIIYYKELLEIEKSKKLDLNITITRPEGTNWKGRTGRIDSNMITELLSPILEQSNFYLCGPPEMVEGTVKILEELCVGKDRINREQW
ncbi:MAG: oxidoreductase [Candidatus Aenigmarchaeota archaeon]|nr:oxidoreductase [Candidatus Aenigmarchaeota archaeon]